MPHIHVHLHDASVEETMHEYKKGALHSGSKKGPKVKNRKQAIAIALKQAGKSNQDAGTSEGARKAALTRKQHGSSKVRLNAPAKPGSTKLSPHEAGNQTHYIPPSGSVRRTSPAQKATNPKPTPKNTSSSPPKRKTGSILGVISSATSGVRKTTSLINRISEAAERRAKGQ